MALGMTGWAHGVLQGVKVGRTDSLKKTGWGLGLLLHWQKPQVGAQVGAQRLGVPLIA